MKPSISRTIALAVLLSVWTISSLGQTTSVQPPADLDSWVSRAMDEFHTPGLGLAIVKDGHVVLAKGYGVRKLGQPEKADENTLFGIASNSKAFTATALAMLVDEGKIKWDDPVTNYLPGFQMFDPYVTREITVRDLLVHRSGLGLGEGDLMYFPQSTYTREEIVQHVRYLKPATSFRSHYAYDNVLYLVGGQVLAAVSGKSWDDFIHTRIFAPLDMKDSNTTVTALKPGMNFATPTATVDGKLQPVRFDNVDNTAPAGAINSSAADMAKWAIVQLNSGQITPGDGVPERRLFSRKQSAELWSGVTILPTPDLPRALASLKPNFAEYALGFGVRDYHGHTLVAHTGGLTGYTSRVMLVPDEKLGIVVLTNGEHGEAHEAVMWHILDHYLGSPDKDWIAAFAAAKQQREDEAALVEHRQQASRAANSKPSLPLSGYVGDCTDAWYGPASIHLENNQLIMQFRHTPGLTGTLEHWQYDTFVAHWQDRTVPDAFVTFQLKPDGTVDQIKMKAVSPLADFSYDFQDLLFTPQTSPK
jgi:CubicO group peptidase (beta-lactamase class C family)